MAKWEFTRAGTWEYPTLGFVATDGDILTADAAPDVYWDSVTDTGQAETVTRVDTGGTSLPSFTEPTDGAVYAWSDSNNRAQWTEPDAMVSGLLDDDASDTKVALDANYVPLTGDVVKSGKVRLADSFLEIKGDTDAAGVTYTPGDANSAAQQVVLSGPGRLLHYRIADTTATGALIGLGVDYGNSSYPQGMVIANKAQSRGLVIDQQTTVTDQFAYGLYGLQRSTKAPWLRADQSVAGAAPLMELSSDSTASGTQILQRWMGSPGGVFAEWGKVSAVDGTLTWTAPLALSNVVNLTRATSGALGYQVMVSGDTSARLSINAAGQMRWSNGAGASDVTLFRSGAGLLSTDSRVQAAGGFQWNSAAQVQTTVGAAGAAAALPATPAKYFRVYDQAGTTFVIPVYAQS